MGIVALLNRSEIANQFWLYCAGKLRHVLDPTLAQFLRTFALEGVGWTFEGHNLEIASLIDAVSNPAGADLDAFVSGFPMTQRKPATAAAGAIYFEIDPAQAPVSVPSGTQVSVPGSSDLAQIYQTTEAAELSANGTMPVESVSPGAAGNAGAGTVIELLGSVTGVIAVTNPEKMTGGSDEESDPALLARFNQFCDSLAKGTPAALSFGARSVPGAAWAAVEEHYPAPGSAALYVCDGGGGLSDDMRADVEETIESGGTAGAPGYRDAAQTVTVLPPIKWLVQSAMTVRMNQGYRLADYESQIKDAAKTRWSGYGLGGLVALAQIGDAAKASLAGIVADVPAVSAAVVNSPELFPVEVLSFAGEPWTETEFEWSLGNTTLSWAGGPGVQIGTLSAAGVIQTMTDSTGTRSLTVSIAPWSPGSTDWPDYSASETVQRRDLAEVTQFRNSDFLSPGSVEVSRAAIETVLGGVQ